ncbi:MAG TPA: hypothetical protein VN714_13890, partial [Trebonia sp.]|nr:hypothetical protein [Trebonia sp.]
MLTEYRMPWSAASKSPAAPSATSRRPSCRAITGTLLGWLGAGALEQDDGMDHAPSRAPRGD